MNPAGTMKPTAEPQFDYDAFNELIYGADGVGENSHIKWEGFFYDGSLRLTKLSVSNVRADEYLEESVIELIRLRENKRITLECKMELV